MRCDRIGEIFATPETPPITPPQHPIPYHVDSKTRAMATGGDLSGTDLAGSIITHHKILKRRYIISGLAASSVVGTWHLARQGCGQPCGQTNNPHYPQTLPIHHLFFLSLFLLRRVGAREHRIFGYSSHPLSLDEVLACDLGDCVDGGAVLPAAALRLSHGIRRNRQRDGYAVSDDGAEAFEADHEPVDDRLLDIWSVACCNSGDRGLGRGLAVAEGGGDRRDDLVPYVVRGAAERVCGGGEHPVWPGLPIDE